MNKVFKNMLSTIIILLLAVGFSSCADKNTDSRPKQGTSKGKNSSDNNKDDNDKDDNESRDKGGDEEDKLSSNDEKAKIDPDDLRIYKLRLVDFRQKNVLNHVISYEIDGKADYVEYRVCPLEITNKKCNEGEDCTEGGECLSNIYEFNHVIVPYILAGDVEISVRSCVVQERSLDSRNNCGKWGQIIANSHAYDPEAEAALLEQDRLIENLDTMEQMFRDALQNYMNDSEECLIRDAGVKALVNQKRKVIELLIKAPFGWMADSVKQQARSVVSGVGLEEEFDAIGDAISQLGGTIADELAKLCHKMKESTCTTLQTIGETAAQMKSAFNPVHSIGAFSNALHDLMADRDDLVKRQCNADISLAKRQEAIEQIWTQRVTRLDELKEILVAKGLMN